MSDSKTAGVETSAISILKRAVELDNCKRFDESVTCYQEGVGLLMQVLRSVSEDSKKQKYRQKIKEYLARAEELKQFVTEEKEASKQHVQIHIEPDSTGHSYEILFGRYLSSFVTAVEVEDPYIRSHHQVQNFLRLCELIVKKRCPVHTITLTTSKPQETASQHDQNKWLQSLTTSLQTHKIKLQINFSDTLHDREIRLDTGWVIKIGRGLDIFKACDKFHIGFCDLDLRHCHETTVDIFNKKYLKTSVKSDS